MEKDNIKRFLVFGDIHGMYDRLIETWEKVKFNPEEDKLLFLGDYIDRGPEPIKCLEFVKDKVEKYGAIALMGNHENMMTSYFSSNGWDEIWVYSGNGGAGTLKALKQLSVEKMEELKKFAANLPYYYEWENYIFCHAGIDPEVENWKEDLDALVWIREPFLFRYNGEKTIVVGHTPVQALYEIEKFSHMKDETPRPLILDNNIIMMDTGSFIKNGKISCMDILSREVY